MFPTRRLIALASGSLFGLGLALSGMTDPARVRGFLDLAGDWNPILAFVLAGAVGAAFTGYQLLRLRPQPFCAERYDFPLSQRIDARLLLGALLFGIGWGLVGLCPGPALADLSTGSSSVFLFVGALLAGMALFRLVAQKAD